MDISIDLGRFPTYFSEEITLYRYPVEFDDNGNRIIDEDNPEIYNLKGSVQQIDSEVSWIESGAELRELRRVFFEYPYLAVDGTRYEFDLRAVEDDDSESPVDGIKYKNERYDLVGKAAEYPQYGFQVYVIEHVSR